MVDGARESPSGMKDKRKRGCVPTSFRGPRLPRRGGRLLAYSPKKKRFGAQHDDQGSVASDRLYFHQQLSRRRQPFTIPKARPDLFSNDTTPLGIIVVMFFSLHVRTYLSALCMTNTVLSPPAAPPVAEAAALLSPVPPPPPPPVAAARARG